MILVSLVVNLVRSPLATFLSYLVLVTQPVSLLFEKFIGALGTSLAQHHPVSVLVQENLRIY